MAVWVWEVKSDRLANAMESKYDIWLEFRELWDASDSQTRLIFLMRQEKLREYIENVKYGDQLSDWSQYFESIAKSESKKSIKLAVFSVLLFALSFADISRFVTFLSLSLSFLMFILFIKSCFNEVVVRIQAHTQFLNADIYKKQLSSVVPFMEKEDFDAIEYILKNRYKKDIEKDDQYQKSIRRYQSVNIRMLNESSINSEPDIFI